MFFNYLKLEDVSNELKFPSTFELFKENCLNQSNILSGNTATVENVVVTSAVYLKVAQFGQSKESYFTKKRYHYLVDAREELDEIVWQVPRG